MSHKLFLIVLFSFLPAVAFAQIKGIAGFEVEKIYTVPKKDQGSWVSITTDPQGRLITCDQYGKLYRVTVNDDGVANIETIDVEVGGAQGLLYAFDSLYVMSHPKKKGAPAGLSRVTDTDNDDKYDKVELLRHIVGGGEHGAHAIVLSPDKKSIYVCAGNHTLPPELASSRLPQNWQEDQVLPRMWDAGGHAVGRLAPGGWICKTDPDGKSFELVTAGFRNQYDFAFSPAGEMFTYDAEMEWDIGSPWYRPTRVCHAVSGGEFGWRSGTGKWPTYYPDSLPPVIDIGPGSPTGVVFGTGAKFPAKYQNALFIADWSYGIIYAVHMQAEGASYSATSEILCTTPGLAVTDMIVNQADGNLYFTIGGRRSQSALYRVKYTGDDSTAPATFPPINELAELRRSLEAMHVPSDEPEVVIAKALPMLAHTDRFIRYAARIAIEHQPIDTWLDKASEIADTQALLDFTTAAIRNTEKKHRSSILEMIDRIDWQALNEMQQLHHIRNFGLLYARHGADDETSKKIQGLLSPLFPSGSTALDFEMSRLLIAAEDPTIATKIMKTLASTLTQEEQIHYVLSLRVLKSGWTPELRKQYFEWFLDSARFKGGRSFIIFLRNIRKEAVENLPEAAKTELAAVIAKKIEQKDPLADLAERPHVKNWTLENLLPITEAQIAAADVANGELMFGVAKCATCHRIGKVGAIAGPDLTAAGRRFSTADLLETIIDPSKEVSDQYRSTKFLLDSGETVIGRIANLNAKEYMIQTDMLDPGNFTRIKVEAIEGQKESELSMMPTGLLNTLTRKEIVDLTAYMRSTGKIEP